ncbi:IS3 family transposase [Streptomyces luteogriseus]|nr:IS3 family transposase [Streptomyces luteogriseus]WTJ26952.1 IS3 family transposase [Streptomyces luteogriseus]
MNRFQFVADHQRRYGVKRLCTILGIARSSFYYWHRTASDRAARQAADAALAARIRAVHRESDGTYGVPRITAEFRDDGERINHKRIARVMRSIGLAGVRLRRRHRTTIADPSAVKAPELIGRDFAASEPNSTSATSPISPWTAGSSSIWPPSSTSPHAALSAGQSQVTCALISSSTPWPPPNAPAAASPERSCTPITAPSTPAERSPTPAAEPVSVSP